MLTWSLLESIPSLLCFTWGAAFVWHSVEVFISLTFRVQKKKIAHMWPRSVFFPLITAWTAQFGPLIWATFMYGTKSDAGLMFCNSCNFYAHCRSTFVTILMEPLKFSHTSSLLVTQLIWKIGMMVVSGETVRYKYFGTCSCGSVVEHCVSSAKGRGFNSQGTHIMTKKIITWMSCKSLWIKASAKCINVNVNSSVQAKLDGLYCK